MSKCIGCPIKSGTPCFAEANAWACKWARGDAAPSEQEALRALSGEVTPKESLSQPPANPTSVAPTGMATPSDLAEEMGLLAKMRDCPHRSAAGCGCSGVSRCALDGKDKTYHDCRDCVSRGIPNKNNRLEIIEV